MDLLSRHSVGLSRMWHLEADSEPRWTSCWNSTNIARRTNRDALWLDQTMIPQLLRIWWQPLLVQWLFIHLSQITSLASPWPTVSLAGYYRIITSPQVFYVAANLREQARVSLSSLPDGRYIPPRCWTCFASSVTSISHPRSFRQNATHTHSTREFHLLQHHLQYSLSNHPNTKKPTSNQNHAFLQGNRRRRHGLLRSRYANASLWPEPYHQLARTTRRPNEGMQGFPNVPYDEEIL
ncbi:uncharacterized protein SEPMUDRAFT_151540 [Sphaerulina musiva SO2202]|uniref:Uncharacterized protein n=1 Tax=Sphaerulina musiva (strain SO2202) TaxID=692275 RepID=N1QDL9_SPHMS|nr:uncharacterized protein SEPMUDRAFT_151540 [Sphaerulina musiva SO2202]EMF09566.1 hypothetical protein SEPMUDRAFT_151540 [Sphaerulina musiva SO2202]